MTSGVVTVVVVSIPLDAAKLVAGRDVAWLRTEGATAATMHEGGLRFTPERNPPTGATVTERAMACIGTDDDNARQT